MADRSVKLTVGMSMQGFVSELGKGERAAKSWSAQLQNLSRTNTKAFQEQKGAADEVAKGLAVIGGAAALAVGASIKSFADFDEKMTQVQTLTGRTDQQMQGLTKSALTAGQAIGVGAKEAADAEIELVKAGVQVKDIMGGALTGSLQLAAAGQMNVADATAIASSTLVQYGLDGTKTGHVADVLAAGADKALGSVKDLGEGLKFVGPVAASLGVSLEQTTGTLALFAQNGIIGEQAGTSLRGVLLSLVAPSAAASDVMDQYGISLYDASGKFVGVDGAAEQLHQRLGGLDEATRNAALGQIFGNAQITAAQILYNGGAETVDKWTKAVDDAGFAQEQAEGKLDNLNGDIQKFSAAWETAAVVTGAAANGPLRSIVQVGTDMLDAYTNAPPIVQGATLTIMALVAAVALGGATMLTAVPRIVEYGAALRTLQQSQIPGVSKAAGALASANGRVLSGFSATASFLGGPWGVGIGLGIAGIGLLNTELDKLKASNEDVTHTLKSASDAAAIYKTLGQGQIWSPGVKSVRDQLDDLDGALQAFASHNSDNGFQAFLTRFTNTDYNQGLNSLRDINKEMGELAEQDPSKAVRAFKLLADQTDGSEKSVGRLVDAIGGDYRDALVKQSDALGVTADRTNLIKLAMGEYADAAEGAKQPTTDNADALDALQNAAGQAAPSIDDVTNALKGLTSPTLDARDAARQYEEAIDAIGSTIKDNADKFKDHGTSLAIDTEEGRKNQAALDSIAQAATNHASALYAETGSQQVATQALNEGRNGLIAALGQYGITGKAAQDYADTILGTPTQWATAFTNQAPDAAEKVNRYREVIERVPNSKNLKVTANTGDAQLTLDNFIRQNDGRVIRIATVNNVQEVRVGAGVTGNVARQASGGPVIGRGTGTSDDIATLLSNGEHVWTARETSAVGGHRAMKALRNAVLAGLVRAPGFATGGGVGASPDLRYVQPSPQIVLQAPEGGGGDVFAPSFISSGNLRDDVDTVMFNYRTHVRGRRYA